MLLTNGKVIFLGEAITAVDYFSRIGYVCPNQTNPADYFMDIMSKESVVLENESAIPKENRFEAIMAKYNEIQDQFHRDYQKWDALDYKSVDEQCKPLSIAEIVTM